MCVEHASNNWQILLPRNHVGSVPNKVCAFLRLLLTSYCCLMRFLPFTDIHTIHEGHNDYKLRLLWKNIFSRQLHFMPIVLLCDSRVQFQGPGSFITLQRRSFSFIQPRPFSYLDFFGMKTKVIFRFCCLDHFLSQFIFMAFIPTYSYVIQGNKGAYKLGTFVSKLFCQ